MTIAHRFIGGRDAKECGSLRLPTDESVGYSRSVPAGTDCERSDRQADVAFQDVLLEVRPFAGFPEFGDVGDAVA